MISIYVGLHIICFEIKKNNKKRLRIPSPSLAEMLNVSSEWSATAAELMPQVRADVTTPTVQYRDSLSSRAKPVIKLR